MTHRHTRHHGIMDHQDILAWGATTANTIPTAGEDEIPADSDEPPDQQHKQQPNFHRSTIRLSFDPKESLLTRALTENGKSDADVATDVSRRRSLLSTTSAASTVDLTSDGGLTSPARTNTPSPPCPPPSYMSFAPYTFATKPVQTTSPTIIKLDSKEPEAEQLPASTALPKPDPAVVALVKKRCISFACGAQKPKSPAPAAPLNTVVAPIHSTTTKPPAKRCMIKFACPGPQAAEKPQPAKEAPAPVEHIKFVTPTKFTELNRRRHSRSPSLTRKLRPAPPTFAKLHREPTVHKESHSPSTSRSRKPKYIAVNEDSLQLSEATRFHEFASDEPQEDDWIRKDVSETRKKLTINDTLEKENAIRRLGKEAEEEALQDEEDEEDDDDAGNDSDDENEEDDDEDNIDLEDQDEDDATVEGSDIDASDGNETDNEAGFADSDDESDAAGDYQFWTPGRSIFNSKSDDLSMIRPSGHRAASESSIDSLKHMSPIAEALTGSGRRKIRARRIKIRPGTPDLPDSTDFVCGTLDEDRPLEDAYVSCMEARKREKHFLIPQDIDPSFPTSDPEDAEENDDEDANHDSDEHVWLHGQFEDSDDDNARSRRRSIRSPGHSPKRLHSPPPKRLHSPPPAKHRLRSPPPPRRLFGGHSPKRLRSPPPARNVRSPPASPTTSAAGVPIIFAPLGQRPGLTHTKSLPRTPNAFCKQYRESRLAAISRGAESSDAADGHERGAIDIVKGLEQKRQRRKEKFYQKHCNRARKVGQPERKPQPGKGAERMRELGLQMAGKLENRTGKAEFVLSV